MKKRICIGCVALFMLVNLCSCSRLLQGQEAEENALQALQEAVGTTTTATGAIELKQYTLALTVGETAQLEVVAADGLTLQWRSTNESVALVNGQGVITAVGEGVANIVCSGTGTNEAACTVTVTAPTQTTTTTAPTTQATEAEPQLGDVFPHSSTSYLTEDEIANTLANCSGETPTGNYAQDAINEIYARHGYVFQNKTIQAFYEATSWYVADSDFRMSDLNAYEKANIELLKTFK